MPLRASEFFDFSSKKVQIIEKVARWPLRAAKKTPNPRPISHIGSDPPTTLKVKTLPNDVLNTRLFEPREKKKHNFVRLE